MTLILHIDGHRLVRRAAIFRLLAELLLVFLDLIVYFPHADAGEDGIRGLFNIAREDSFGTWFSST